MFFCVTKFVGLIHGGAYFRNFSVLLVCCFDVVVLILSSVSSIFSITPFADRTIYNPRRVFLREQKRSTGNEKIKNMN